MFSLIISIISILLIVILAVATIMYVTNPSEDAMASTSAAKYVQEGAQLYGAIEAYKAENEGSLPGTNTEEIKEELMSKQYLRHWPQLEWDSSTEYITRTDVDRAACIMINKRLKLELGDTLPSCDDSTYSHVRVCCSPVGADTGGEETP